MKRLLSIRAAGRLWLGLAAALSAGVSGAVGAAAPSLRDVMSAEDFARAGLHKLTPAELEFLSARLLGPAAADVSPGDLPPAEVAAAPAPRVTTPADSFGREKQIEAEREQRHPEMREVQSRVVGPFSGWTGATIFRLENGQVWQQVEPGTFAVNLESPVVRVRKGRFGAYYLGVEGYGSQIKVRRVK